MPPISKSKPKPSKPSVGGFTAGLHNKFRTQIRHIRSQRSPKFQRNRKAYVRRLPGKKLQTFKGVHGLVEHAFGSISELIKAGGPCLPNKGTWSRTLTSRGSRIGRELCRVAGLSPKMQMVKSKKEVRHQWTMAILTALRQWGIYLVYGELPVCHRYVATGVDLLGVQSHPTNPRKWQLVCIEIKTGYRGPVWEASPLGLTRGTPSGSQVRRSILNYALTQAQITHECATATLKEYEFAAPIVVRVNSDGVFKYTPSEDIQRQARAILLKSASK